VSIDQPAPGPPPPPAPSSAESVKAPLRSQAQYQQRSRRLIPRWRKATWALAVFNVLALVWLLSGIIGASNNCSGLSGGALSGCQAGTAIGAGIGVTLIVIIWFIGFMVLGLVWLMSRPRHRQCPRCGEDVKKGLMVCNACGFDYER
jgi:hypothetical protein